jgi:hypothetical protein
VAKMTVGKADWESVQISLSDCEREAKPGLRPGSKVLCAHLSQE